MNRAEHMLMKINEDPNLMTMAMLRAFARGVHWAATHPEYLLRPAADSGEVVSLDCMAWLAEEATENDEELMTW